MKIRKISILCLIFLCLSIVNYSSVATSLKTFDVSADTFVIDDEPSGNYGTSPSIIVDDSSGIICYGLLYFNLGSIMGHTIINATLSIETDFIQSSATYQIAAANESWTETGVTWNTRPGAHSNPTVSGSVGTALANLSIDVTSIVGNWTTSVFPNRGFLLSSPSGYYEIHSRESSEGNPPVLTVFSEAGTSKIPLTGLLWIIGMILTIACIYYLSHRTQITPLKNSIPSQLFSKSS